MAGGRAAGVCLSLLTLSTAVCAIPTHSGMHIPGSSDALFVYELDVSVNFLASHDPKKPRAPQPRTVTTKPSHFLLYPQYSEFLS